MLQSNPSGWQCCKNTTENASATSLHTDLVSRNYLKYCWTARWPSVTFNLQKLHFFFFNQGKLWKVFPISKIVAPLNHSDTETWSRFKNTESTIECTKSGKKKMKRKEKVPCPFGVLSDHFQLFQCAPPVLKVDICSILEGVIGLNLTPVALSEFSDPFFQLLCLTLSPPLQYNRNMRSLSFLLFQHTSTRQTT